MTHPYRRMEDLTPKVVLDEELLEKLAEVAATRAIEKFEEKFYTSLGKQVVGKVLWAIGIIVAALWAGADHYISKFGGSK